MLRMGTDRPCWSFAIRYYVEVYCLYRHLYSTSITYRPENSRLLRKLKSFGIFICTRRKYRLQPASFGQVAMVGPSPGSLGAVYVSAAFSAFGLASCLVLYPWGPFLLVGNFFPNSAMPGARNPTREAPHRHKII